MLYNTGKAFAYSLTVTATNTATGVALTGYPRNYNIRDGFSINNKTYPDITDDELKKLSVELYTERADAFLIYIQQQEPGMIILPGSEPVKEDLINCPIV